MAERPPKETTVPREILARFLRRMPKQSRSRAVVEAITEALEEQLARTDDPEGWTLEAIVERAGVGVGSFYEYFSGKESLLGVLIGHVTERNFKTLLAAIDDGAHETLEDTVRAMAKATSETYLARPTMTRALVKTIARLGLIEPVFSERDRFAAELAVRAARFLPHVEKADLEHTMRLLSDAVMGVVASELARNKEPDVARCAEDFARLGVAVLRDRHPEP